MIAKVLIMIMSLVILFSPISVYGQEMNVDRLCSLSLSLIDDHHRNIQKGTFTLYQAAQYKEWTLVNNAHLKTLTKTSVRKAARSLPKMTKSVNDGKVVFRNLKSGIYYVIQSSHDQKYYPVKSFFVTMPESDEDHHYNYDILASPKVEETYQQENQPSKVKNETSKGKETTYKSKPTETKDVDQAVHEDADHKVKTQDTTRILSYVIMLGIALATMLILKRMK